MSGIDEDVYVNRDANAVDVHVFAEPKTRAVKLQSVRQRRIDNGDADMVCSTRVFDITVNSRAYLVP